jgi:phospholipid/cholesterol/gamma-HCH transport system substrate-binding protein
MVREGHGVEVPLKIYDYIKIPDGSKFTVGSSGLLGDRFVSVTMPPGQPKNFIAPNSHLSGTRENGLDDLTREGGALVTDLRGTVRGIDNMVTRLNEQALSPASVDNLKASITHLNETTGALAESSKKLDGVIEKADSTMDSTKKAAVDLQSTILEARKVLQSATQGKGVLATLLSNQELANDLRALIANLRAHGVLFYRDTTPKTNVNPQTKPPQQTLKR